MVVKKHFLSFLLLTIFFLFYPGNGEQTLQLERKRQILQPLSNAVTVHPYPKDSGKVRPPELTATAAAVLDLDSGVLLYGKNINLKIKPASTVKMMTALTALDYYDPQQILTSKTLDKEGAQMGLKIGERVTVENLLYGLLLNSGSDAALALADNYNGGIVQFLSATGERLKKMNIKSTHFTNIIGYDEENNYTTSKDLVQIARFVLRNPLLKKIVSTKEIVVTDVNVTRWYPLKNINELLWKNMGVYGIKTGWTEEAGECLVSYIEQNNRKIITAVMGSNDRFGETELLTKWVFKNFEWIY